MVNGNGVTKYDLLENEIDQLKEAILEIKGDLKELKSDLKELKNDIDSMKRDMEGLRYDVDKIKEDINTNKTGITRTWSRLTLLTWAVVGLYALMIIIVLWNLIAAVLMPHHAGQLAQQGVQQGMQIGVVKVGEQHDVINPPGSINPSR